MLQSVAGRGLPPPAPALRRQQARPGRRQRPLAPQALFWDGPKKAGRTNAEAAGTSSKGASGVPAEFQRMFVETARNLQRLNEARLRAQEELRDAQMRIQELDARTTDSQLFAGETERIIRTLPGGQDALTAVAQPPQVPGVKEAPPSITLLYSTGWSKAFLHFRADHQSWTSLPGEEMAPTKSGARSLTIPATHLEFVLTNGENGWDTPDPYGGGRKNYTITAPGMYSLKSGRVSQLA